MIAAGMRSFVRPPKVPLIIQSAAAECGLACMAMVSAFYGHETDLIALRRKFSVSTRGMALKDLFRLGQKMGMVTRGVHIDPANAEGLQLPAILHWDHAHYVVLTKIGFKYVTVNDPAQGTCRYSKVELATHFTGFALELRPSVGFEVKREVRKLRLGDLFGRIVEIRSLVTQTMLLSVLLQIFALISPLYIKIAIDEVSVAGDGSALFGLALGFSILAIVNSLVDCLRSIILTRTGGTISYQLVTNLFYHFVRLPLPWFEQRHIGDMTSRFTSTEPIKKFVTEGLPASLVDGLMVSILLIALVLCDIKLASIAVATFALRLVLRLTTLSALKYRGHEMVRAEGREHSAFVETAMAIQSIKIAGREAERQSFWQNRYASALKARLKYNLLQSVSVFLSNVIVAIENILISYAGITVNLSGTMSIGLVFTFLAYRQQFVEKGTKLLDALQELRLLDLHLDRVSDIALNGCEGAPGDGALVPNDIHGSLSLQDVSFRFSDYENDLLCEVNLDIAAGEFIAITGPSGGGKTTLMKVMLGLFVPNSGQVLIDGKPLGMFGIDAFRSQIGVVMQDDRLLSGSIADNICFFDGEIDVDWMRDCAKRAGIDRETMGMPMNYNTIVGDMGATLSGGQSQRILLTRALYRRPKILFLDEGTSHLDVENERQVNLSLSELSITRIIIAHRPETVNAADRVVLLRDRRLIIGPDANRNNLAHYVHPASTLVQK